MEISGEKNNITQLDLIKVEKRSETDYGVFVSLVRNEQYEPSSARRPMVLRALEAEPEPVQCNEEELEKQSLRRVTEITSLSIQKTGSDEDSNDSETEYIVDDQPKVSFKIKINKQCSYFNQFNKFFLRKLQLLSLKKENKVLR
jgi:hypothetical protein